MKIILKRDYRIFKYEKVFGAVDVFSPTLLVDAGTLDTEPVGEVTCTLYTTTKIGTAETGRKYDVNWLWTQMIKLGKVSSGGASPQDAFSVSIKGMKVVPTGEIDTFPAYFRVDTGSNTPFDNIKSAIQSQFNKGNKRPVGVGSGWYAEWGGVLPNGVMPMGKTHTSDHEWLVCGWDAEHPNCFKIDAHIGYYMYMPKEVFNATMAATYGAVGLTIAQTTEEMIEVLKGQKIDLIKTALDFCYNLLKILQAKLATKTPVVEMLPPVLDPDLGPIIHPVIPKRNMINEFALAIQSREGYYAPGELKDFPHGTPSWRNKNPGNCKDIHENFLVFSNYATGFAYLENYIERACKGKHPSYKPDMTITQFFRVYAPITDKNDPDGYAIEVCGKLRILTTTKIKDLLV